MLSRGQTAQPRRSQFLYLLLTYFFKSSFINDDDIGPLINQSQHWILLIDV